MGAAPSGLMQVDTSGVRVEVAEPQVVEAAAFGLDAVRYHAGLLHSAAPLAECVTDLLADLMHLASQAGLPFEVLLEDARREYRLDSTIRRSRVELPRP